MSITDESPPNKDARTEEFLRLMGSQELGLVAYLFSLVAHWSDVMDIAQDVRLRLWQQFDEYDPSKDFGAWCRTIAYYQVLAYRKRCSRAKTRLAGDVVELIAEETASSSEDSVLRLQALSQCLDKVHDAQQQILVRHYGDQEPLRQIAASMGRSYDAVRQGVLRLRKSLARCIDRVLLEQGGV